MKDRREQQMRLIINGAISLYENECLDIPSLLKERERTEMLDAYDALGTALYWLKEELEKSTPEGLPQSSGPPQQ